jgi:hypothetical protein
MNFFIFGREIALLWIFGDSATFESFFTIGEYRSESHETGTKRTISRERGVLLPSQSRFGAEVPIRIRPALSYPRR